MSCSLVYTTENNQTYPRTKLTALLEYLLNLHFVYSRIQEVIGALVTHIGSGTSTEANTALEVLDTLVNNKLQAVQRFTLLIKVMIVGASDNSIVKSIGIVWLASPLFTVLVDVVKSFSVIDSIAIIFVLCM